MPTLGDFHKVVCDCLGLWASENNDVIFTVPATEKSRREALSKAFDKVKKTDDLYGSHEELVAVTTQIAPKNATVTKKDRTVQAWVQELSRTDFGSHAELDELGQYIEAIIDERYSRHGVSQLAVCFYRSAMMYYREFLRECPATQANAYDHFLNQILTSLITSLAAELHKGTSLPFADRGDSPWPLVAFLDSALSESGISRHKLYQFHVSARDQKATDAEVWARDLKSTLADTRTKQTVGRFTKPVKIKFTRVLGTLAPLAYLLRDKVDEVAFKGQAFSAFVCHNLRLQVFECEASGPPAQDAPYPQLGNVSSCLPVTDTLDLLFENAPHEDEADIKASLKMYRHYAASLRLWSQLTESETRIPTALDFIYGSSFDSLSADHWYNCMPTPPIWMVEWQAAVEAMLSGNDDLALNHFQDALAGAKYTAGPLFTPLYLEICAFCKRQYQRMRLRGQEAEFDSRYDQLGGGASKYAGLLGYTPASSRDPLTLMPSVSLRSKNTLIIRKIDSLV
jgi:hypothetical protein